MSGLPLLYPERGAERLSAGDVPARRPLRHLNPHFGTNNAPFYNFNTTYDFLANLTKVWGNGTRRKVGVLRAEEPEGPERLRRQQRPASSSPKTARTRSTPSYPLANAATGVFRFYDQASIYPIGEYRYWNVEWYLQDNWKPTTA